MSARQWNDRFNVSTSKDNHYVHEFYREYFSKPRGKRLPSLTSPKHSSLSPTRVYQLPRLSTRSRAQRQDWNSREQQWNTRFHVAFSKDNSKFHWTFREYFGVPKDLNYPLLSTQRQVFNERKTESVRRSR